MDLSELSNGDKICDAITEKHSNFSFKGMFNKGSAADKAAANSANMANAPASTTGDPTKKKVNWGNVVSAVEQGANMASKYVDAFGRPKAGYADNYPNQYTSPTVIYQQPSSPAKKKSLGSIGVTLAVLGVGALVIGVVYMINKNKNSGALVTPAQPTI